MCDPRRTEGSLCALPDGNMEDALDDDLNENDLFLFCWQSNEILVFLLLNPQDFASVEKPWLEFRASYICESLMLLASFSLHEK